MPTTECDIAVGLEFLPISTFSNLTEETKNYLAGKQKCQIFSILLYIFICMVAEMLSSRYWKTNLCDLEEITSLST